MKIEDYIKVGIASLLATFLSLFFTNNLIILIIIYIIIFNLLAKYKKFEIKHDIKTKTRIIKESIEEINEEDKICKYCGSNVNNKDNFCKNCGNKLM